MALPIPPFTGNFYQYVGLVPSAETLLENSSKTLHVVSMILTNISAGDITVTLKNNQSTPATEAELVISANDQIALTYEAGWEFIGGLRLSDGDGTAIRIQIKGYKEF